MAPASGPVLWSSAGADHLMMLPTQFPVLFTYQEFKNASI